MELLAIWWRSGLLDGVVPAGLLIVHGLACQDVRLTREQPRSRAQFHELLDHLSVWRSRVPLQELPGGVEVRGLGRTVPIDDPADELDGRDKTQGPIVEPVSGVGTAHPTQ